MELVAYVVYFVKTAGARQPHYEQVKADIQRLLTQSENVVKRGLFPQDDYDLARFMICAWVDETILSSAWNQKGQWQREQLQRQYYQTLDAGEEAFERLNRLGLHQREVREVYYLCLALGFKGRFHHPGDEYLLEQLKTSNLKLLLGSSVGLPSLERNDLFPEAYPIETVDLGPQKQKFRFSPFTIACLAGPIVLFGLLFLVYRFALSGIAENFLKAVP
jgi:type VI secretion system protein ImpK